MRRRVRGAAGEGVLVSEPDEAANAAPPAPPEASSRRVGGSIAVAAAIVVIVVAIIATTPFWAPSVIRLLPWGQAEQKPQSTAPDPALAAARAEASREAATIQQLNQRIAALEAKPAPDTSGLQQRLAALEAKPAPDLSSIRQQLTELDKATADLGQQIAALGKAEQQQTAGDPKATALVLAALQIRGAIEVGRPFVPEYQALVALSRDHPDIAAAAAPLADAAETGVASRAVLTERLRQLAPQIATARPPPKKTLKSEIVARLRALVTIRRIDGVDETPAEAAVSEAQNDMASGDLAGAIAALDKLDGPAKSAAEPWLKMAKARLTVETALRQVQVALTASLGGAAPASGQGG
jgi:hypothetical protein